MTTSHTPGRLKVQHPYAGERGWEIAFEPGLEQVCQNVTEANARRLVACWNTCKGLTTEHLENIDMLGETLAERFAAFRASERELMDTRDKLPQVHILRVEREMTDRELIKQVVDYLMSINPGNMTPMAEEIWLKSTRLLIAALEQPEETNQCGETCERAKLTHDKQAVVQPGMYYRSIKTDPPPVGPRMLLINAHAGVAQLGRYDKDSYWTHWHPLPQFRKDEE